MMSWSARGDATSAVEVTHISSHGVWLLARDKELFMPYDEFPWFQDQPVRAILNVEEPSPGHFHWPDIDVDLTEEIIEHPERFPNRAKGR
jgi:hypothetical protein